MPVPTGATQARGAWSDTLPVGQDVIGQGFPTYNGGAFVQETQSVGPSDFEKGISVIANDPLGGTLGTIRNILENPLGSLSKGASEVGGMAGSAMSSAAFGWWKDWGGKIVLGVLGLVLVIVGLMALSRGSGDAIAEGIKEGIANARSGN